jgi:hypothetical protein
MSVRIRGATQMKGTNVFQKDTSENNTNILSQKTKRPRRKRFNLEDAIVCQENMDMLFNLTFKQIPRTREGNDFTAVLRSYFVDELKHLCRCSISDRL